MFKQKVSIGRSDIFFGTLLLLGALFIYYRIAVDLNYVWNWGKIPQFLFRYDDASGRWVTNVLMWGFFNTLRLSIWSAILALIIGTAVGICRTTRSLFLRLSSGTYVELLRNLPPLVIIFIVYFFVGSHLLPLDEVARALENQGSRVREMLSIFMAPPERFAPFVSAMLTLAIFEGAYIAEIVRAGIQSIDKGQWEAGHCLGLSKYHQMRHIILPQAFGRILPPLAGQFISLIKDSSIVSVISIAELTFRANELMTGTLLTMETWIVVTVMYLVLTLPCSLVVDRLEKRASRSR
jgi:polar amino acid transport system permease protein